MVYLREIWMCSFDDRRHGINVYIGQSTSHCTRSLNLTFFLLSIACSFYLRNKILLTMSTDVFKVKQVVFMIDVYDGQRGR